MLPQQHTAKIISHPKLTHLCTSQSMFPSENIIFSIIIILAPLLDLCEINITNQNTQILQQIINKLQNTPNNRQKYYGTEHDLQNFKKLHKDLCKIPETINKEIYNIIMTTPNINSQILQDKYPTIPLTLIEKTLECLEPLYGFNHPIPQRINPPTQPQQTNFTHHKTIIYTWNVASLNTALPGIQTLILHNQAPPPLQSSHYRKQN
jgi:hypothetical protein